jgi:lipopolysaccharide export system protein LptC
MSADPIALRRPMQPLIRIDPPAASPTPAFMPGHQRYGRGARIAKIALPLLALGLAALVITWSQINPVIQRLQISETEQAPEEIDTITMENARFAGVDAQDRTFNVTAARAIQSAEDSNRIELQHPRADIALADGAKVAIQSDSGGLQRDTQILDLFGSVTLVHDRGYEFRTTSARVDLGERTATGDAPIEGHGPDGDIRAEGFEVVDGGAGIIFRGRSRAVFQQQPEQAAP